MNRTAAISLILLAAAGGFAAGWRKDDAAVKPLAVSSEKPAPVTPAEASRAAAESEDTPPALPELNTVEDCREFLRTSAKQFAARHPLTRQAIRDYALRRWLELDAESALQEAERQPGNAYADSGFAPELFRVWLDLNVDSAIEGWTQANPLLAKNVRAAFLTALADKDPARAFELWKTPRGKSEHKFYDPAEDAIFARWAQTDPEGALKKQNGDRVWLAWIAADPAAAFARLKKGARDYDMDWPPRPAIAVGLLPWLLANSPGDAAELIAAGTTELSGNGFSHKNLADSWLKRDAPGALRWAAAQSPPTELSKEIAQAGAKHIATSEPEAAIRLLLDTRKNAAGTNVAQQNYQNSQRSAATREAFASLAATDPQKAQELLAAEPELAKNGGLAGYLTFAFAGDSAAAIQQTREWLRDPALKEAAADGAMMAFRLDHGAGARDPSELLAAIPELADKVDGDVLSGWAKANPTGAADFIMERLRAGHEIKDLRSEGVLAELAISRPEYTAVWLQRLPEGEVQQQAATALAANWSAFDPEAAAAWIDSLPAGPAKEAAAQALPK